MTLTASLIRLFAHVPKRRRKQLAGLIVLMLVGAIAEMATLGAVVPFLALLADPSVGYSYPLLQNLFATPNELAGNALLAAAFIFVMVAIIAAAVRILLAYASYRFTYGLGADIGGEVYKRTLYQPYSWHVSRNTSEILAGIQKVNAVTGGVIMQLVQGAVAFVIALAIVAMLMAIDLLTAFIAAVGFSTLYGLTTLVSRQRLRNNSKLIAQNETRRIQAVQEGLGGIRDVLLDGTQPVYHRRFTVFDHAMRRAQATNAFIGASPRYFIEATGMVLIVALAYWLSGRQGGLLGAIPVLGALAIGAQKLLPQMQLAYFAWSSISGNRKQLDDVLQLLERPIPAEYLTQSAPVMPRRPLDGTAAQPANAIIAQRSQQNVIASPEGAWQSSIPPIIALRNVSFRYKSDSPDILKKINLEIPKGARIGIIGKTGSGKSTLVDLIMGLLDPTEGEIEINGQLLTTSNRRAWQSRIAHVPQAIFLADSSIAENIALGIPSTKIDMERVKDAARKAQLADFIETLPQQYQTVVGERGVRLSGGQRQRIGLARALYKQADILVLDEATSALDNATEVAAMEAIEGLCDELTILIIAHRVSTLNNCYWLIEMSNGQINFNINHDAKGNRPKQTK